MIRVEIVKSRLPRRQPWRWVAKASNHRKVAVSGEWFTNKADAWHSLMLVFASGVVSARFEDAEFTVIREAR